MSFAAMVQARATLAFGRGPSHPALSGWGAPPAVDAYLPYAAAAAAAVPPVFGLSSAPGGWHPLLHAWGSCGECGGPAWGNIGSGAEVI